MTSDCPVGWFRRDVKRRVLAILALIGLGAGALVSLLRDPPGADVSSPKAVERGQYFQGRVVGF